MLTLEQRIAADIATSIAARPDQVRAAVELLDGGATVPFIARYRKEVTGGLDDTQLRLLEERLGYLRELEDRRAAVIASIEEQGKITDALRGDILAADTKSRLEDLYLPYKPTAGTSRARNGWFFSSLLGDKAFEQCAGFLRIPSGDNPLDASSVHPEAYPVVERILANCGREVKQIVGDSSFLRGLKPETFTDEKFGVPTVRDILRELENPGRDPRPEFKAAAFAEGIEDIKGLNVAAR